ncbi:MAG: transcriptional repressor [Actinobacteria bacterium]|nr:transcriptional repressor [Actinomycetota bacterium]
MNNRITKQRRIILKEIKNTKSHPTAYMIFEKVKNMVPNISLGTVYRNLEILSNEGLIKELKIDTRKRRYDGNINEHYHIRCIKCGRVDDLKLKKVYKIEDFFINDKKFKIIGHNVEFYGLCPECKK